MATIQVLQLTPEVVAQYEKDGSVQIITKKEEKAVKGTIFKNFRIICDGKPWEWISIDDVPVSRGAADPNDATDKRNEFEGTRMNVETNHRNAPLLVYFLWLVDQKYQEAVRAEVAAGRIVQGKREIHTLVRTKLSENNAENPGGEMEKDKWSINMKVSFKLWSNDAPFKPLRGLPKSQILDHEAKYVDARGIEQYESAQVEENGKKVPLNENNFYKFINEGAVLRKLRIHLGTVAVSQQYISCPIDLVRAVVETGGPGGFSDEQPVGKQAVVQQHVVQQPAAVAVTQQPVVVATPLVVNEPTATEEEVNKFMASI
jgi:hypothetical protein